MGQLSDLEKILCEERDAVNLLTIVERLRSLCQWVRVDEVGRFTIFDQKPEDGPTYAWKDTMVYIPDSERLGLDFEDKCSKLGPLLMKATDLIEVTGRIILSLGHNHKIHTVRKMYYMKQLCDHEIILERKKSEDLMREVSRYLSRYNSGPLVKMFRRYNHEI